MADNVDNLFKRFVDFHGFWGLIPLLTTNVYISILADEGQTWIGCAHVERLNRTSNAVRFLYI